MESLGRLPRRLRLAEALPGCLGRPEYSSEEECSSVEELGYRSRSRTAEEEREIGEYSASDILFGHWKYCQIVNVDLDRASKLIFDFSRGIFDTAGFIFRCPGSGEDLSMMKSKPES